MTASLDTPTHEMGSADRQMSVAVSIGDRLVAEAIWSGDRCNWVGAESLELASSGGGPR
jgi:lantibiotic biosynthesis protein